MALKVSEEGFPRGTGPSFNEDPQQANESQMERWFRSNTPFLRCLESTVEPTLDIPSNLPSAQDAPEEDTTASSPTSSKSDQTKAREEEARDILARAVKKPS